MSKFSERINDPEYKNWLKCQQVLYITQQVLKPLILDALTYFVDAEMRADQSYRTDKFGKPEICQSAACANERKKLNDGDVPSYDCLKSFCNNCAIHIKTINRKHNYPPNAFFTNCNIGRWPKDVWEVAKAFLTIYFNCKTGESETVDIAGWLTILRNCKALHWISAYTMTDKQLQWRHSTFHTPDFKLNNDKLKTEVEGMWKFLEDILTNLKNNKAKGLVSFESRIMKTMTDITEVKNCKFTIELEDNIFHQRMIMLEDHINRTRTDCLEEIKKMKEIVDSQHKFINDCKDLSQSVYDSISQIKRDLDERVSALEGKMESVEGRVKIVENEIATTKVEMGTIKGHVETIKGRLATVEKHMAASKGQEEANVDAELYLIADEDLPEGNTSQNNQENQNRFVTIEVFTSLKNEMDEKIKEFDNRQRALALYFEETNERHEQEIKHLKDIIVSLKKIILDHQITDKTFTRKHGAKKLDTLDDEDRDRIALILSGVGVVLKVSTKFMNKIENQSLNEHCKTRKIIDRYIADHPDGTMDVIYVALDVMSLSDTAMEIDKGIPAEIEASQPSGNDEKELGAEAAAKIKTDEQEAVIVKRKSDPEIVGITNAGSAVQQPTEGVEEKLVPETLVVVQSRTSLLTVHDLSLDSP